MMNVRNQPEFGCVTNPKSGATHFSRDPPLVAMRASSENDGPLGALTGPSEARNKTKLTGSLEILSIL